MPLCLAALTAFYSLFGALGTAEQINELMCTAARQMAARSKAEKGAGTLEAGALFTADCIEQQADLSMVGGAGGVLLTAEMNEDHMISLHASYLLKLPLHMKIPVSDTVCVRAWLGDNSSGAEDSSGASNGGGRVYVAENGVDYHTDPNCTYLHLSIRSESLAQAEQDLNIYGCRYRKCALCGDDDGSGNVYVTSQGDSWHKDRNCSALKRTVGSMSKDEAADDGLHPCPRCGGEK